MPRIFLLVFRVCTLAWSIPNSSSLADSIPVAVSYFENVSEDPELDPLKKGIAEMLITDLSISEDIHLVERARLQELLAEMELQKSPRRSKGSSGCSKGMSKGPPRRFGSMV